MPYLAEAERQRVDRGAYIETAGELTYAFTRLILDATDHAMFQFGAWLIVGRYMPVKPRYVNYCTVIGAIMCTQLEFKRRSRDTETNAWKVLALSQFMLDFYAIKVAPYENLKMQKNGDVYA